MGEQAGDSTNRAVLLAFARLIVEACRGEERVRGFEVDDALADSVVEEFGLLPADVNVLAACCWHLGSLWDEKAQPTELMALAFVGAALHARAGREST